MSNFWWFIHITGICLWFGVTVAGVLSLPSNRVVTNATRWQPDVKTVVALVTRTSHIGAGLTALGGTVLSFMVQPKSDLGVFWLFTMQGLGAIAFVLTVTVLTRLGKRVVRGETPPSNGPQDDNLPIVKYRRWLLVVFLSLVICLVLAAFKPAFLAL